MKAELAALSWRTMTGGQGSCVVVGDYFVVVFYNFYNK